MDLGGKSIMHKVYEMRVSRLSEDVKGEVEKNIRMELIKYRRMWNMAIFGEIVIFLYLLYISII